MRWTVITNCDSFFITKCDTVYYKLRQVLQSAMDLLQIATVHMYMWVKFTFPYYVEAMHERSLVSVKVEPRSTSRLNSALFILLLFYDVIKIYVRYRA